ncbi:MAG: NAD-dependent protein deacetylase [Deinococcota bacterium]
MSFIDVNATPLSVSDRSTQYPHQKHQLEQDIGSFTNLLQQQPTLVLTGAGISTESGIPDYRGPTAKPRNPMRYQEFVKHARARQRYWARSAAGWLVVKQSKPNAGHVALARLEQAGLITGIITQNVDGLHQHAGSQDVLELHGQLSHVRCLSCGTTEDRLAFQTRLLAHNPRFQAQVSDIAPDGDAEIPDELITSFDVPACHKCGGVLKPDVVFFGENVPKVRVARAWQMLERAGALLVLGSSLTVRSGYRFVVRAVQDSKPVAIINQGPTRGDADASLRLSAPLGSTLGHLADALIAHQRDLNA